MEHADLMRKIILNSFRSDLHVFTLFFSVSSLLLQVVWSKTFILAVFSMSPRLVDCPLSFVENPSISTSWFLHTFGSEFDAMGKQTGWTFKPKSIAGSVGVKWPKIYDGNIMSIPVVEFSSKGFKIRKFFGCMEWNYWILRIGVVVSCQELDIILENKVIVIIKKCR